MPVILDNGSEELKTWLDPGRSTWSKELQSLLRPFEGELEIYPVSQEVGKVGNNSPSFIIPVASSENKSNIANFFAKGAIKGNSKSIASVDAAEPPSKDSKEMQVEQVPGEDRHTVDHNGTEDNAPRPIPKGPSQGIKRELEDVADEEPRIKIPKTSASPREAVSAAKLVVKTKSATSNIKASPKKGTAKEKGTQKITSFFGK